MKIFGVKIDKYEKKLFLNDCFRKLELPSKKPLFVVTLNPEILLEAAVNPMYKKIINQADARIVDGFGIKIISWLKKKKIGDRITGADLARSLIKTTSKLNLKTGLVFFKGGLSSRKEIKESLKEFNKIKLISTDKRSTEMDLSALNDCQLILVAIGHPYQESLIYNSLPKLPKVKIIVGIGGTLDYWTHKKIRAPKGMQIIGLEWLWRIFIQPNRIKRTFDAIIKFPILALSNKKYR